MKRIFLLTLTLSILLLSACSFKKERGYTPSNTETETVKTVSAETNSSTPTTSSSKNTEIKTDQTTVSTVSSTSQATELATKNTEKAAESSVPTKVEQEEAATQVESNGTTVITEPPIEEEAIIKATASDCSLIANKVIEYINAFRMEEGTVSVTKLSGLTEYAEYRSRQLVSNFAHDTVDERVAATALQYGEYIEPSLYGMTGEPYYTANAREAIAKTSFGGTVDDVAKYIARMAKNSSDHWNYVGSEKYQYIAVGISYESGNWYCCIAMSRENTDNK